MQSHPRIDGSFYSAPYAPQQPTYAATPWADSMQVQPLPGLPQQAPEAAAMAAFQAPQAAGQPPQALTHYAATGPRQHKRPMTFSLLHVAAGVRPLHINTVSVKLECDDLHNANSPCFLVVCGHTENGLQVAAGAGAYGMSTSIYGGGSSGDVVRFARRIDSLHERQQLDVRLHNAGLQKQRAADLSDWVQAPVVDAIDTWKVGEYLEHTGTHTGQLGWLFGNTVVQKLDVYAATENHRSVCVVKTGEAEATVSVTPIRLKTAGAVIGNKAEQSSWWHTRTFGQSEVFRYDLRNAQARAQLMWAQPGALQALPSPTDLAAGVQKIQQLTLHQQENGRAMTAFGGRIGYSTRSQQSTLTDEDLLTGITTETQTSSRAKTKKNWDGGAEHDRWEVSRVKAIQGGTRTFQRMIITKQCALAAGAVRDFGQDGMPALSNGCTELATSRNNELLELGDAVQHAIPQFEGQQWPSTYAVRVAVTLTPDDIDKLSRLHPQQVLALCQGCGNDPALLQKVVGCFADMADIEQKYERLKACVSSMQWAGYDDQATQEQADKLHGLLNEQRAMPHVVTLLAAVNAATGMVRPPVVQVACKEYDDADAVVSHIDALAQLPSPIKDARALEQHFKAHTQAVQSVSRALLIAANDTVSKQYDCGAWESSQDAWRHAMERLIDAEAAPQVAQLPEADLIHFRRATESRSLFSGSGALEYASLPQRLEVVLRQFNVHGRNNRSEREAMADLVNALEAHLHNLRMTAVLNRDLGPVYNERRNHLKAVVPELLARLPTHKTAAIRAQVERIAEELRVEDAQAAQGLLPAPPQDAVWCNNPPQGPEVAPGAPPLSYGASYAAPYYSAPQPQAAYDAGYGSYS